MVKGAPDYSKISIIKGLDADGNALTVLLDATGKMLAVMQGQYDGAPTTLLTDPDGRIQAALYGVYSGTNIQVAVNAAGQLIMADLAQANILKDESELQTWDSPIANLLSNMNRIRYQIITITGEVWGTVSHSIAAVWAKFHATTGHKHTGGADDAPLIPDASLESPVSTHAALTTTHGGALQTAAMKNAASGIAGLDANARVPAANSYLAAMSSPARAFDTIYTNGSRPRLVIISAESDVGATAGSQSYQDGQTPDGTTVMYGGLSSGNSANSCALSVICFLVAPGATYSNRPTKTGSGTITLYYWKEIDL